MPENQEHTPAEIVQRTARAANMSSAATRLALARWKSSLGDTEARQAHFQLEGSPYLFDTIMEAASSVIHEELHERYGSCQSEDNDKDFNSQMLQFVFMLGRAFEEHNVIILNQDEILAIPMDPDAQS